MQARQRETHRTGYDTSRHEPAPKRRMLPICVNGPETALNSL